MGALLVPTAALTQLCILECLKAWLETQRYHLSPRTFQDYGYYITEIDRTLRIIYEERALPFYDEATILDIDGDLIRAYQHKRREKAQFGLINKETGIIKMVRERVGRPFAEHEYTRLPKPKNYEFPGRKLEPSEEAVWERTCIAAADRQGWDVAALCSLITVKAGPRRCELLNAKLKDVSIGQPTTLFVQRRGAKRVTSERIVVLIGRAEWAMIRLLKRAREVCGCADPEHFLIPFTNRDHSFDPTRPAKGFRSGMDHLHGISNTKFRYHDQRHHAASKALSHPSVPLAAARKQFGNLGVLEKIYYHADLATLAVVAAAAAGEPVQNQAATPRKPPKNQRGNNYEKSA